MHETQTFHHISSAVVMTRIAMEEDVVAKLVRMDNVEVHAHERGKIVVVIEGSSAGTLGDCLSRISALDGVVAANMVFEHVELEEMKVDERTHPT